MTTLIEKLEANLIGLDEIENLVITLPRGEMDIEFSNTYGSREWKHFVAWSEEYIYYSEEYDGMLSIGWVSKEPPEYAKPLKPVHGPVPKVNTVQDLKDKFR